jgi:ankyrin repeat protein
MPRPNFDDEIFNSEEEYYDYLAYKNKQRNERDPQHILIDGIIDNNIKEVTYAINKRGANISRLINKYSSIRCGVVNKNTPILHLAIEVGNIEIVLIIMNSLLASRENIDMTDILGNTCLHLAASRSHYCKKILEELVKAGANVNAVNDKGDTPLHTLIKHWKSPVYVRDDTLKDMILLFLKYGADINIQDNEGKTHLHYMVNKNKSNNVKVLLENGADLDIKDNKGNSCMSLAMSQPNLYNVLQEILSFSKISEDSYNALVLCTALKKLPVDIMDCDFMDYIRDYTGPLIKPENVFW